MRRERVLPAILRRLPPDCRRIAIVPTSGGGEALSVVVATNKTVEELARAQDLEMIQNVQRVMAASKAPAWYVPQRAWFILDL